MTELEKIEASVKKEVAGLKKELRTGQNKAEERIKAYESALNAFEHKYWKMIAIFGAGTLFGALLVYIF